jgi:hypothetical protein
MVTLLESLKLAAIILFGIVLTIILIRLLVILFKRLGIYRLINSFTTAVFDKLFSKTKKQG